MLDHTVEAKRRRRLHKGAFFARITHITEERLVQSRRVELDKSGIVTGKLKCVRRAGWHVQKIARPQRYLLFVRGHTHRSIQTKEGLRVFLMHMIRDAMSFGSICHQYQELAATLA